MLAVRSCGYWMRSDALQCRTTFQNNELWRRFGVIPKCSYAN